jgi:diguanylate cyclase (GGDEF)-like protein
MSDNFSNGRQVKVYNGDQISRKPFQEGVELLLANLRERAYQANGAKEVIDLVLDSLQERGYRVPRIWAKERKSYRLIAANDFPEALIKSEPRFGANSPLLEEILQERDICNFVDVSDHQSLFTGTIDPLDYVLKRFPSAVAMVAVPYKRNSDFLIPSDVQGLMVLNYDSQKPGAIEVTKESGIMTLSSDELKFLNGAVSIVADKVVQVLERNRESDTGLYNRGKYRSDLDRFVGDFYHNQRDIGLLLMDFDHFKSCNDEYGHHVGDEAINGFASVLKALESRELRPYHQGGDEFGIITFGDDQKVIGLAKTLLHSMPVLEGMPKGADPLTLSIGMKMMAPGIKNGEEWYKEADDALYRAKDQGRNQFAV